MNEPLWEFEEIQLIYGSSLSQEYTHTHTHTPHTHTHTHTRTHHTHTHTHTHTPHTTHHTQLHKYLRAMGYRIHHNVWSSRFFPDKIPGSQNLIYPKQKQCHAGAIFKGASWGSPLPVGQGHCEAMWISSWGSTMAPGDILSMPSHGPA